MSSKTPDDFQTMAALFSIAARRFPGREALVADNARLTYAELNERTDRLALALRQRGAGSDTIVGALLLDGLPMVELIIASAKAGCTLLALNWRLAPGELQYILEDAKPELCFVSECFVTLFQEAGGRNGHPVAAGSPEGIQLDLIGGERSAEDVGLAAPISRTDRWFMLYTSGTTGKPKGCQHSQGGYYLNVLSWLSQLGVCEQDTLLSMSPLFHVHGFGTLLCALVAGMKIVIPDREASIEEVLHLSVDEGVSVQPLWPFPLEYLEALVRLELPLKLRLLIAPGGALPVEFIEQLVSGLETDMRFIYGQTEGGCWITMCGVADQIAHPKSCGRPLPHLLTRLVDDAGNDVPLGSVGELLVAGETITTGYLNLPEATGATLADGWLHTGDLCKADADGFIYIAGRKKELIKTGGENVYPAEVDTVLSSHPEIADACVVGVPDERWGEAVKAFVVRTEGSELRPAEVVAWCKEHIAGYKRPRYIEFVGEIPRDFNHKPQRRKLAERPNGPQFAAD